MKFCESITCPNNIEVPRDLPALTTRDNRLVTRHEFVTGKYFFHVCSDCKAAHDEGKLDLFQMNTALPPVKPADLQKGDYVETCFNYQQAKVLKRRQGVTLATVVEIVGDIIRVETRRHKSTVAVERSDIVKAWRCIRSEANA